MPGVRATRITPVPSARDAGCDRRALRSAAHDVLPCVTARARGAVLVGQAPGDGADLGGAPCRRTPRRWPAASPARRPARTTRRPARGSPARPTSSAACAPTHPAAASTGHDSGAVDRRPAPCRPGAGPPSASRRRATRPSSPRARRRAPRPVPGRRRTQPGRGRSPAPTGWGVPPSSAGPLASARRSVLRVRRDRAGLEGQNGVDDRLPAGAPAQVGGEGAVDGGGRPPGGRRHRRDAHDDPGRAEPALRGAGGGERRSPHAAASARPSSVVTARRRRGRAASRRTRGPGRRPTPCSSRTGPGGCSRPWRRAPRRSRRTSRSEAPSSATSTGRPSA